MIYARPLETLWTIQQLAKRCQRSASVAWLTFLITHHPLHSQALTNYAPLRTSDRAVSEYSAFLSGRGRSHIHTNPLSRQELVPTSETLPELSSASTQRNNDCGDTDIIERAREKNGVCECEQEKRESLGSDGYDRGQEVSWELCWDFVTLSLGWLWNCSSSCRVNINGQHLEVGKEERVIKTQYWTFFIETGWLGQVCYIYIGASCHICFKCCNFFFHYSLLNLFCISGVSWIVLCFIMV